MSETFGKRLRKLREGHPLGPSQTDLAEYVGVKQPTVSRWEKDEDFPGEIYLAKIAEFFDVDIAYLRYGKRYSTRPKDVVPLLGFIGAAERVTLVDDHAQGASLDTVPAPPGMDPEGLVAVQIRGDSMRPLRAGWTVYYTKTQDGVAEECLTHLCVVKLLNGEIYIKELRRGYAPDRFNLVSWTAGVDPMEDQQVEWAARVLWLNPGTL